MVFRAERPVICRCHYLVARDSCPVHSFKTEESVMDSMREGFAFVRKREGMVSLIVLAFLMTMLRFR